MFITKKKFKLLLTNCILETGKHCGKNLGMKDIAKIKNVLLNKR